LQALIVACHHRYLVLTIGKAAQRVKRCGSGREYDVLTGYLQGKCAQPVLAYNGYRNVHSRFHYLVFSRVRYGDYRGPSLRPQPNILAGDDEP
jgi:hypothetical protein